MKENYGWAGVLCCAAMAIGLSGCGTVKHSATFAPSFNPAPATKLAVSKPVNSTGESYDVDITGMLEQALRNALEKSGLLEQTKTKGDLLLDTSIVGYLKGNAFKRWLLPGWGGTLLEVRCTLKSQQDGTALGTVEALRTVSAGGGYTVGAWRTICDSLAEDVVTELRAKIK